MRHMKSGRKLGRVSEHRKALFRNQLRSLITHERIITTLPKAKELRPIAEKVVTLGRRADSVHARRLAERWLADRDLVRRLFTEIGPRFVNRPGGYTRIVKLGPRRGDAAELAIVEFVDFKLPEAKTSKEGGESKKDRKRKRPAAANADAGSAPSA
ncbi:MAG TPA: 50S ribosomal protein L17 [Thermoanaerobaculaceae bacterium]|nr:50S ribosomal protein L17 [Thermoanaerobaculaceae bacterium]